jgi:hypothetical protein
MASLIVSRFDAPTIWRKWRYFRQQLALGKAKKIGFFIKSLFGEWGTIPLMDVTPEEIAAKAAEARRKAVVASKEEMDRRHAKQREGTWTEDSKAGFLAAKSALLQKTVPSSQEGVGI